MRVARCEIEGRIRAGLVERERLRLLPEDAGVLDVLTDRRLAERATAEVALTDVRLLAPLEPGTIRDFVTFEEHVEGTARAVDAGGVTPAWYEIPTFYFTNPWAVRGPYDDIPVPPGSQAFDFELELAAVIGSDGFNLSPAEAADHIAGYTILNDWSARDLQAFEMQIRLGPAKGKDTANTLGPWIVSADELEQYRRDDRLDLEMEAFVNGEPLGGDTSANMGWSFEELVAYASRGTWVRAGDVLGSGTCGAGCLAEIWGRRGRREPPPLQPGDVVELRVEGIGSTRNRIVEGVPGHPIPRARPPRRRERSW